MMHPNDSAAAPSPAPEVASRRRRLLDVINASWMTQAIAVAAELRLADHLAEAPRTVAALAHATGCHAPSLLRLLCALASLDMVTQRDDGHFELTATGQLLRTGTTDSLAGWAVLCGRRAWANWAQLAESVRTGHSARKRATGSDDFSHLDADASAAEVFHRAMTDLTQPIATAVASTVDFAGVESIADIGGGHGQLIATILAAHPAMRGVLFDLAHATTAAEPLLHRFDVASRCERIAGSFFDSVPVGADVYLLKSVLHDWDDEHCLQILRNCRVAMAANPARSARLLLIERMAPEWFAVTPRDQAIARSDLNMLVSLGGRERTEREYRALLNAAGLVATHIAPLPVEYSVVKVVLAG